MKSLNSTSSDLLPEIPGYSVVEQLYLGSRTAVYRAVQTATQRPVVIKVLRRDYPSFGELVQFRNQYAIAKNLPIPGIVQPLSLEPLGNGYGLVMEDCGGVALGKYIQQQSLDLTEVLAIALQLADILHDLIQHRVVHKDIKPANILIQPESKQVKLIDFSIASLLPKETQEIQSPNILEGTLAYLAPEQTGRMNRGIDYRADFYALGVTLYQLLTATLPFASDDPLELMHCHIAKVPVPAEQVNPDVPVMVAAIVMKLMAKNAEDRYQSALGLKHDLEQCLTQWKTTGEIAEFELGQRDLSDRFLIPEKLYGRQAEVNTLLEAFERVADGASELMLVAGFSGIGKTAVVNEVHKPIVRQRGYFIKGKFDQFNRNIPLSAFVQALRDLMGQLLSESDGQLAQWRAQILTALGENGQVLIEVIPELELIIGKQPITPELSGSTAQNRFNLLFQKFIEVFTTAEHPLVVFLDDLQWADSASLQLIKLLMSDNGYLLMLGAYRDNEVSPVHPFILTVEEIRKANAIVNTITLAPLDLADTNHLVADTLNCSRELAQPLTELIDRKTKGNPFFTTQFLKALHEDGQIIFDHHRRYWECDIAQVNALALTDDVVEFMALQLQKLPLETQQVLKLAACVGNQFDLATLAIVLEKSSSDVATELWKALQEGLILPTSQIYKFFQTKDFELSNAQDIVNPTYRFLHDRVQQAAYSLISEQQRQQTHWQIGQLILRHMDVSQRETRVFEIVNQLNYGISLLTQPAEQEELAALNLLAGQKAKLSTAYASAYKYFKQGCSLLNQDCWQTQYHLAVNLHIAAAEAACLNTDFEEMKAIADAALMQITCIQDQVKIYDLLILYHHTQSQFREAVNLAVHALTQLGESFPTNPNSQSFVNALNTTTELIQSIGIEQLHCLPPMQLSEKLAAMRILRYACFPAYFAVPEMLGLLVCRLVDLTLKYGLSPLTPFAYGIFSVLINGGVGNITLGEQFGELAISLENQQDSLQYRALTYNVCYGLSRHFYKPLRECLEPLLQGYESFAENGDAESSSYCLINAYFCSILSGESLEKILQDFEKYIQHVVSLKHTQVINQLYIWTQFIYNLSGREQNCNELKGKAFDIDQMLPHLYQTHNFNTLNYTHTAQVLLAYTFNDYERALTHAQKTEPLIGNSTGKFFVSAHNFYYSLSLTALYLQVNAPTQTQYLEKIQTNQKQLQHWTEHCPANFEHKYLLVQAELARITQMKMQAIDLYDRAIAGANANGYIQEEALANELAAKFYLDWGKEKIAASYMQDAYYGYARWGAKAKVQDLECRYPQLLAPILQQQRMALSATETVFATTSLTTSQAPGTQSSSSDTTSVSAALDLATVLKASQTLSSEIQLDKLLATLLHTVLENAGADKGALLMPHENQWFVEAVATVNQPTQMRPIALSSSSEVPQSLINAVKRSREPVVIVDALIHPTLAVDAYIVQQQSKSVLCTPILNQGKLVAILYLENHVTVGAFTRDRLQVIQLLTSQAAISLENAQMYCKLEEYSHNLEQKVSERTQEVTQKATQLESTLQELQHTQAQLIQSEKMSSLGQLVAGIAHEINNPVNFIHGNISYVKQYMQDLLNLVNLYQQSHVNQVGIPEFLDEIDLDFIQEDLPKTLKSMQVGTERIREIVLSLRNFSRMDEAEFKQVDIHAGIDSTLMILQHRLTDKTDHPAIEIIKDYGKLPLIECYAGQLNQVFMNILTNAIDAIEEKNIQQIFEEIPANPQQIKIRTSVIDSNWIEIAIADNGIGMTSEVQKQILNPFFTTKSVGKGTGMGMSISYQIITEKHGGKLECFSTPNQGTEFVMQIPIRQ
jgi:predicted ATPase/signal transduction histidine kinase